MKYVFLSLGGMLGVCSRYWTTNFFDKLFTTNFPIGTFVVNVLGCFFIGLLATLAEVRFSFPSEVKLFLITGFLGAFTTFSTFAFDSQNLFTSGQFFPLVCNIFGKIVLGLLAVQAGIILAKL